MATPSPDRGESVKVPLTQFVREVAEVSARAAAKEVLKDHVTNCPVVREFGALKIDVYGKPGNKDDSPGIVGEVASLKHSRRNLWVALRWSFGLIAGLIITGAGVLLRKLW